MESTRRLGLILISTSKFEIKDNVQFYVKKEAMKHFLTRLENTKMIQRLQEDNSILRSFVRKLKNELKK
jgi:membrane protein CcdC involved in cytochrome C biogenesis